MSILWFFLLVDAFFFAASKPAADKTMDDLFGSEPEGEGEGEGESNAVAIAVTSDETAAPGDVDVDAGASPSAKNNNTLLGSDSDSDDDVGAAKTKANSSEEKPTVGNAELFGSDSDSDEDAVGAGAVTAKEGAGETEVGKVATSSDVFGSDDENEVVGAETAEADLEYGIVQEEQEEVVQEIDLERAMKAHFVGRGLNYVKMPNFLNLETQPFSAESYKHNDDKQQFDDVGRERIQLKYENTIRWRFATDECVPFPIMACCVLLAACCSVLARYLAGRCLLRGAAWLTRPCCVRCQSVQTVLLVSRRCTLSP
jgi:RNA polymerase-associated protein LEO1